MLSFYAEVEQKREGRFLLNINKVLYWVSKLIAIGDGNKVLRS